MKFNTDSEIGKIQYAIWKKQTDFSKSITTIFHRYYRDLDIIRINLLSLLIIFPVVSFGQVKDLASFQHVNIIVIHNLQRAACVNIYNKFSSEYEIKKLLLPNLCEKCQIIESLRRIKAINDGTIFDIKAFREITTSQLARKTNTPYSINNRAVLIEITAKGKLLLEKYLFMYSHYFNAKIPDTVEGLKKQIQVEGLFSKSVEELKEMARKDDILELILKNRKNKGLT